MRKTLPYRFHRSLASICASFMVAGIAMAGCSSSSTSTVPAGSFAQPTSTAAASASAAGSGAASSASASSSGPAGGTGGSAAAALVPAAVRQAGELKVATGSGYPPFEFYGTDNKTLIGVDPEIMQALGAVLGLKVTLTDLKFDAIIPGLQSARFDAGAAAMSVTADRNKIVDFVSYFKGGTSLIVASGNPAKLTLDNLCGHTVAVEKGTIYANSYLPTFSAACTSAGKPAITVGVYPDQPQATLALSSGRAEASMSDYGPLAYIAQQAKGKFDVLQENYKPSDYGIAFPKGSQLAPAVEAGLKTLIANGTYLKILDKWQVQAGAITDPTLSRG